MRIFLQPILLFFLIAGCLSCRRPQNEDFVTFVVNAEAANIEFYWKNENGELIRSLENMKYLAEKKGKTLRFAMNGGMYQKDNTPLGLFIQHGKVVAPLNLKQNSEGNFYLQPNGVFYITEDKQAFLSTTQNFREQTNIKFATQSGPMLLIEGEINPNFKQGSGNLNIRNGVCVLDKDRVVFSMSRREVNFYDFAKHFKDLGCRNALFLDGFVSRMYLPEQKIEQLDGDFGVIIGIMD
jgi:uncharacterized protein YigE (DUF2233 family)